MELIQQYIPDKDTADISMQLTRDNTFVIMLDDGLEII